MCFPLLPLGLLASLRVQLARVILLRYLLGQVDLVLLILNSVVKKCLQDKAFSKVQLLQLFYVAHELFIFDARNILIE